MYFSFISNDVIILGVLNVDFRKFCNTKTLDLKSLRVFVVYLILLRDFVFQYIKHHIKLFCCFGKLKVLSCLISQGIKFSSLFEFNKCSLKLQILDK